MPAVRSSTGMPITVRCSEQLAQRLGMIPLARIRWRQQEDPRLVFFVSCSLPYPVFEKAFLWPAVPGLGTGDE